MCWIGSKGGNDQDCEDASMAAQPSSARGVIVLQKASIFKGKRNKKNKTYQKKYQT